MKYLVQWDIKNGNHYLTGNDIREVNGETISFPSLELLNWSPFLWLSKTRVYGDGNRILSVRFRKLSLKEKFLLTIGRFSGIKVKTIDFYF